MDNQKNLLRFLTCGSVDDGKSTLIGRLLYDCNQIYDDQLCELANKQNSQSQPELDLAELVDGLQSEREQGITIDVAYKYFATKTRKFIVADTPGHEQYTRNMVTGASNCDLAIIILDATKGILKQAKRHTYICYLLGIKNVIVAVNKMDIVGYERSAYKEIKQNYKSAVAKFDIPDIKFVPISARLGDNVVNPSQNMMWYSGSTLLRLLETVTIQSHTNSCFRMPVQYVNRCNSDFRGFCGSIASGTVCVGDEITVYPSKKTTTIQSILFDNKKLNSATENMSITLTCSNEIDISRGDMILHSDEVINSSNQFSATIIWFSDNPATKHRKYIIKFSTKQTFGIIKTINEKINIDKLENEKMDFSSIIQNEISKVSIETTEEILIDQYKELPSTGSFIVIDSVSYETVGAGMIIGETKIDNSTKNYSSSELALNRYICDHFPEWNCINLNKK